jgi:hypothetical protein
MTRSNTCTVVSQIRHTAPIGGRHDPVSTLVLICASGSTVVATETLRLLAGIGCATGSEMSIEVL